MSLAPGFQVVESVPSARIAARRLRAVPPTEVKPPPAHTVGPSPLTATARTAVPVGPAFGSQEERVPFVPIAARRLRADVPPIVVKEPPTYTVLPSPLTARA